MEPSNVVYDICRHYVADSADTLGPIISDKINGYLRSRTIRSLTEVSSLFDPVQHGHRVLQILLQVEAFFKKCDLFSDEKCSEVAFAAFLESEEICRATNERLDAFYDGGTDPWITKVVERMADVIRHTLGPVTHLIEDLPSLVRVTNGATATQPRAKSSGALRLRRSMYATPRSHKYLTALSRFWGYRCNFRSITHNRVELVPKNWKTHRTIACEPEGNSALQLAFDSFCKRRLKSRLNIDLSDQSRNQQLALESSVHGKLCTVDLKAASDRLSLNVVHLLFEREWVDFFLDTRSPQWKFGDRPIQDYHKLSSMGNGYTFTIETLVFAAACKALGSKQFSVYGDDIIIETELLANLKAILAYLGFEVNQEKTHENVPHTPVDEEAPVPNVSVLSNLVSSNSELAEIQKNRNVLGAKVPSNDEFGGALTLVNSYNPYCLGQGKLNTLHGVFRESCGVHAYGGHIVTPFYVRSLSSKRDWVLLVNNMASLGTPEGSVWKYLQRIISELKLPLGPPVLDTTSCVFIDVSSCYRLGLIKTFKPRSKGRKQERAWSPFVPVYKGLVSRTKENRVYDSRALFLWFLNRKSIPYESSRYTLGTNRCKSKWVRYSPAMADLVGGSVHLHWWTETLLTRKG